MKRGGNFDRWDLEVRCGLLSCVRLLLTIEEHGAGKQLIRLRVKPHVYPSTGVSLILIAILSAIAALNQGWIGMTTLLVIMFLVLARTFFESATAVKSILTTMESLKDPSE